MDDWQRYGYASYEAWVESKAGASPEPCPFCGTPGMAVRVDHSHEQPCPGDAWPEGMPKPPPFQADDEALEEPNDA